MDVFLPSDWLLGEFFLASDWLLGEIFPPFYLWSTLRYILMAFSPLFPYRVQIGRFWWHFPPLRSLKIKKISWMFSWLLIGCGGIFPAFWLAVGGIFPGIWLAVGENFPGFWLAVGGNFPSFLPPLDFDGILSPFDLLGALRQILMAFFSLFTDGAH